MKYNYHKIERCPVCKSTNISELYHDIDDKLDTNNCFSLFSCIDCTHAFTSPAPDSKYLSDYYSDLYYSYNVDISSNNKKLKFRIKRWLYESSNKNKLYRLIAKPIILQTAIFPKQIAYGKILDIGCGNGAFLSFMKEIGWLTFGIEISQKAVDIATQNGHKIFAGNLIDAKYPDNYFDVITLNNVMEHLLNPSEELKEINRILKPKGEIIICVPNFSSLGSKLFKENWIALLIPEHLHHFSEKSLRKTVENNSFKNVKIKGIFRKLIVNNIIYYIKINTSLESKWVAIKAIGLMLCTFILSPLLFFKIGVNFCPFITLTAYKKDKLTV